ncbi:OsmC family protein [Glycomyces sp. L485]|uniref:OsmC family protein n=1 Tax=Glycomyces sp. L485 TaxID=2909235 RepID=UPI001F4B6C32|nr:OsmC family protein [Glycomyces sp. L485]MCH7232698.1 OsmC family protein [Glycomyces sp. L485]
MRGEHYYEVTVRWTGNTGSGTLNYRDYGRDHDVLVQGKPTIKGSADRAFRGHEDRWNPEDLLVASLSECHMLTYLALCARSRVVVVEYEDLATGRMEETGGYSGRFAEVVLNPKVVISDESKLEEAVELHQRASQACFISKSVNFPVRHNPTVEVA